MEIINAILDRYSSLLHLISLLTWGVAWLGADYMSKGKRPFEAHVLFTVSNLLLIGVHFNAQQWELMLMALTFLKTSVTGCFHHRPKINPCGVNSPHGE